jgi:hypothetical protein
MPDPRIQLNRHRVGGSTEVWLVFDVSGFVLVLGAVRPVRDQARAPMRSFLNVCIARA